MRTKAKSERGRRRIQHTRGLLDEHPGWGKDPSRVRRLAHCCVNVFLSTVRATRQRRGRWTENKMSKECQRTYSALLRMRIRLVKQRLENGCIAKVFRAGYISITSDVIIVDKSVSPSILGALVEYALILLATSPNRALSISAELFDPHLRQLAQYGRSEFSSTHARLVLRLCRRNAGSSFHARFRAACKRDPQAADTMRGLEPSAWEGPRRYAALRRLLAITDGARDVAAQRLEQLQALNKSETTHASALIGIGLHAFWSMLLANIWDLRLAAAILNDTL